MTPETIHLFAVILMNITVVVLIFTYKKCIRKMDEYKIIVTKQSQELNLITRELERNNNLLESYRHKTTDPKKLFPYGGSID